MSRLYYNWEDLSRGDKTSIISAAIMKHIYLRGNNTRIGMREINVNIGKHKSNLRIDVLEINRQKNILVGYEVKSCIQDFRTDKKWKKYLDLINQLYFIFDEYTYNKHKEEIEEKVGNKAGIYVYMPNTEYVRLIKGVKYTELPPKDEAFYRILLYNYLFRKAYDYFKEISIAKNYAS